MPATVTLATATLTYGIGAGDDEVTLSSVSDVVLGYCLWMDRELLKVNRLVDGTNRVKVTRGVGGTAGAPHSSSAPVTIGRPDWFYSSDPVGAPPDAVLVSPYINALNGKTFVAQGNVGGSSARWWEESITTRGTGPLGVRTAEVAPSAST